jgi:hypothetical protein
MIPAIYIPKRAACKKLVTGRSDAPGTLTFLSNTKPCSTYPRGLLKEWVHLVAVQDEEHPSPGLNREHSFADETAFLSRCIHLPGESGSAADGKQGCLSLFFTRDMKGYLSDVESRGHYGNRASKVVKKSHW